MADNHPLLRQFASSREEDRLQALKALFQNAGGGPEDLLFKALGDDSWRVRKEAVELYLSHPRCVELIGQVVSLLQTEENAGLRNAAVEILVRLGRPAVQPLLTEVSHQDPDVRKFVLDILGDIGDTTAIDAMVAALEDAEENVRCAAAENLGKLRAVSAVPALQRALGQSNQWFRYTVLEALGAIGAPIDEQPLLAFYREALLRKPLFDCLGRCGGPGAVPLLIEGLSDKQRHVREFAALALVQLAARYPEQVREAVGGEKGCASLERVAQLLAEKDRHVRAAAVKLLGWSQDVRFAGALLDLFEDEQLREEAARALVEMGSRGVTELLRQSAGAGIQTRIFLCCLVGEVGCSAGADLLLRALQDEEDELRQAAAHSLGQVGGASAVVPLIERLHDDCAAVREASVLSLCRLSERHREVIAEELTPYLEHQDPRLRMNVIQILGHLNDQELDHYLGLALKDESALVRRAAVRALGSRGGEQTVSDLKLTLTDEDAEVRREAVEMLGRIGGEESLESLLLALEDEDIWVRAAAVRSLGCAGGKGVLERVAAYLRDPVGMVAIAAMEALERIDPQGAAQRVMPALDSPDEEVVKAAMETLGRSGSNQWLESCRERLVCHPHWDVRFTFIRMLVERRGAACRDQLEAWLTEEDEEMVRSLIQDSLNLMR